MQATRNAARRVDEQRRQISPHLFVLDEEPFIPILVDEAGEHDARFVKNVDLQSILNSDEMTLVSFARHLNNLTDESGMVPADESEKCKRIEDEYIAMVRRLSPEPQNAEPLVQKNGKEKELAHAQRTSIEGYTREQVELVKRMVAKGATDDELRLFLYRAKTLGLDPLSQQIYFIKRRQRNPVTDEYEMVGTIQIGIDGYRSLALKTGKLQGIKRGLLNDGDGKMVGAWAEVFRSDWKEPARAEVSFKEYQPLNPRTGEPLGLWSRMPSAMIQKVAEASALRMAFADMLGGTYVPEEMEEDNESN